jgi:hypothetical protein
VDAGFPSGAATTKSGAIFFRADVEIRTPGASWRHKSMMLLRIKEIGDAVSVDDLQQ